MMMLSKTRKIAYKQIFSTNLNQFLFASRKNDNTDKKLDGINEDTLGNYKGIIYSMRKDSQVAEK